MNLKLLSKENYLTLPSLKPHSAYIHIPFCRRRCYYCDFPILVLGNHTNINKSLSIAEYVEVLCQEIKITPSHGEPLLTVFFGGGTPSLLPAKSLETIILNLDKHNTVFRIFKRDRHRVHFSYLVTARTMQATTVRTLIFCLGRCKTGRSREGKRAR